jgi:endonuclease-3
MDSCGNHFSKAALSKAERRLRTGVGVGVKSFKSKITKAQNAEWQPPSQKTVLRVHQLLIENYGSREVKKRDPLDGMILIMLSQATNDINCDRAFTNLKQTFPTWENAMNAPVEKIADAIRVGGLANQKAARIKKLLEEIYEEQGDLDLSWMFDADAQTCREYMEKFHGVGPKTIACVLVFFLDKPAFPVDTHVFRVTKRLGWIREKASPDEAHRVLEKLIPDECKLDLHVNLISHGRAICRANGNGGPQCGACFLRPMCAFGQMQKGDTIHSSTATKPREDFFVTVT